MEIEKFLKGKIVPHVTISFHNLNYLIREHGFSGVYVAIEQASEMVRKLFEYQYNATCFLVTNSYGDIFKASLIADELAIWSSIDEHLVTIQSVVELGKVRLIMDAYTEGEIPCSRCEAIIRRSDIAGKMYAGVYCKACWEGGMRQREARENYN